MLGEGQGLLIPRYFENVVRWLRASVNLSAMQHAKGRHACATSSSSVEEVHRRWPRALFAALASWIFGMSGAAETRVLQGLHCYKGLQ